MKSIIKFIKKETVLTIAWLLAIISAFFVTPSAEYLDYIDFKSLGILWCLMLIVKGLSENGLFDKIGSFCLSKTKATWQLVVLLVFMPFFFSMLITNDVALLTFVPFAIYLLEMAKRENLLIPVIALQTIAANLGSMLTPIGNPQNLYLYGLSGLSFVEFILLMAPYSALALLLLVLCIFFIKGKRAPIEIPEEKSQAKLSFVRIPVYLALFFLAVFAVAFPKIIPYKALILVVLLAFLILNTKLIFKVDYALLFTFVGFFIFTGNLGNISAIRSLITTLVAGNEVLVGAVASQGISNVPAALLLSGFTEKIPELIIGVNLGGLGTLIASMASLISFKLLAHSHNDLKGKYFALFTLLNIIFLVILFGEYLALS